MGRGKEKRNKALDSQMQKESVLECRGIEAFIQADIGSSG